VATSTPPGASTTLTLVLTILDLAAAVVVRLWLDGGWGVDALLGQQSRQHGDLDVAVEARHLDVLLQALDQAGFERVGEQGATAWNFLLAHLVAPSSTCTSSSWTPTATAFSGHQRQATSTRRHL
jgi:lincosamide nucleotidyltransferase A/C/D/E